MTSSVYLTGTVSVSGGNAVVTGTGTAWSVALVTGGMFSFQGQAVPIASVESDTSLTLAYPWPGATAAGAYAIARETSEAVRAAWINDRLAQILTKLSLAGIHPDGAGTLAERDALSPVPAAGFLWLRVETGFDLAFYKRTGSGWDGPFSAVGDEGPQGPIGPAGADGDVTWEGPWVIATAYTANQALSRNGSAYVCTANHTAGTANEPGVGVSWATVWDLLAAKGDAGAGVSDGDKGDISVSGGAWSIDNNAVTYGKMQDVTATARVIGRKTAGAGDPEELTFSDVLDMVGSAAQGDILYRGASGWVRLPKGTAAQYLKQNTALTAPEWVTVAEREVLTANRTYYVRTDGSDANNGLANTIGGAFLTIQKAIDVATTIDFNGFVVTVQIADGTYAAGATIRSFVGQASYASFVIKGNSATPSNVTVQSSISASSGVFATVQDFKLAGGSLLANLGGVLAYGNIEFGAGASYHVQAADGGSIICIGNYAISGGATRHLYCQNGGLITVSGRTIEITGTPAFSTAFAIAATASMVVNGITFVGSATGARYSVSLNGAINTGGGGASYLPGSVAGTTATGGQYA